MQWYNKTLEKLGNFLVGLLVRQSSGYKPYTPSDFHTLCDTLQPGDILLIEGNQFVSGSIKYLTQSTWSHAAFFVGNALPDSNDGSEHLRLIEVTLEAGCVAVPISKYANYNTRICRPVGLTQKGPAESR